MQQLQNARLLGCSCLCYVAQAERLLNEGQGHPVNCAQHACLLRDCITTTDRVKIAHHSKLEMVGLSTTSVYAHTHTRLAENNDSVMNPMAQQLHMRTA
jgi:hypothetical protein